MKISSGREARVAWQGVVGLRLVPPDGLNRFIAAAILDTNKEKYMRFYRVFGYLVSMAAATLMIPTTASFAAMAGPAHSMQPSGDTLATVQKNGVLRVGVAINAPWVLRDKDGQWIGLEIDFIRQLTKDMHWKLELVPTTWASAIGDLRDGHFDLLASGLSVTPQRTLLLK